MRASFFFVPPAATAALLLAGCNSVHTSPAQLPLTEPTATNPAAGIPYRLPSGLVTLKLAFPESGSATDKRLAPTFELATSHYPDPSTLFLLQPSHNALFDTHHVITVSDGLLSTISTTETSKIKEVVLSLVQTGLDFAKLKAAPLNFTAQSDADTSSADIFLNDSPHPTAAEVAYALESALGSKLTLNLIPGVSPAAPLPLGSAGLLSVSHSLRPEPDSLRSPPLEPKDLAPLKGLTPGIYTRSLRSYRAEANLLLDLPALHKLRVQAHEKALRSLATEKSQHDAEAEVRRHELERAKIEFNATFTSWSALQARHAALELDVARHDLTEELLKTRTTARDDALKSLAAAKTAMDAAAAKLSVQERIEAQAKTSAFKLGQQRDLLEKRRIKYDALSVKSPHHPLVLHTASSVVTLPDPETLVRVPITRSGFGTTTNTIEFKAGILTKYDSTQPSGIEGFVAIPAGIVNAFAKALVASDSGSTAATTSTTGSTTGTATGTTAAAATPTTTTTTNTTTATTTTTGASATPPPSASASSTPP